MEAWRRVEVAACEEMAGPTEDDLQAIRAATFTVEAVKERERITDHDVAAFVDVLSESAGPPGRYIHFGLTSSDVLDTALALQLRAAGEIVVAGAEELVRALAERAREHVDTVCVGRTHGVHAEPTTFGIKLAGFAFEAERNAQRLRDAFAQATVGALSGAVGTWHEGDISHSGAERVILPDATILLDYMQHLALRVVRGLVVHPDRMRANLDLTHGALFSQRVMLAFVERGHSRDDAYRIVQEDAQRAWDSGVHLRELL